MSIEEKRQKIAALQAQIAERKTAHSIATSEANDQVREARLDREVTRLEAELAAIDSVAAPTADLSSPEAVGAPVEINVADDASLAVLKEQAKAAGITGYSRMSQDELIAALTNPTNTEGSEG